MRREIGDFLQDILEAMSNALEFVEGMSYEEFSRDTKTLYALIRAVEIMGEAVKNIPDNVRNRYPEIPWKGMAGMRDKVIHGYFNVRPERIWEVVKRDIPKLKPHFEKILEEIQ